MPVMRRPATRVVVLRWPCGKPKRRGQQTDEPFRFGRRGGGIALYPVALAPGHIFRRDHRKGIIRFLPCLKFCPPLVQRRITAFGYGGPRGFCRFARGRKGKGGIRAQRQKLFLARHTVFQPPQLAARWHDSQMQAASVKQLVRLSFRFGLPDLNIGKRHAPAPALWGGISLFWGYLEMPPEKYPQIYPQRWGYVSGRKRTLANAVKAKYRRKPRVSRSRMNAGG